MLQLHKSIITAFHNSSPRCKDKAETGLNLWLFQWKSGVAADCGCVAGGAAADLTGLM